MPAGDMAASALSSGGSNSTQVKLDLELDAPSNSTSTEIDASRYGPALAAALASFADLPLDRVEVGLRNGSAAGGAEHRNNKNKGKRNNSGNSTAESGKCGARSKKPKRMRKNGACSSFVAVSRVFLRVAEGSLPTDQSAMP